jgi:hypothetical protein
MNFDNTIDGNKHNGNYVIYSLVSLLLMYVFSHHTEL